MRWTMLLFNLFVQLRDDMLLKGSSIWIRHTVRYRTRSSPICLIFQRACFQQQKLFGTLGMKHKKFQDCDTQGFQKLVLYLPKVHSWLTYGLKSVIFWWYFTTFHENDEGVLLKIWLYTPTKTVLEGVLFEYVWTNTNIAGF